MSDFAEKNTPSMHFGHFPLYTLIAVGLNTAVYCLFLAGKPLSNTDLLQKGAKSTALILEGSQAWRLLSMHLLHASLWHLLANMLLLFHIGSPAESLFGKKKYLLLMYYSALGSACASCIATSSISVGFSGVLFGLWGGFAALGFRHQHLLSATHRKYVLYTLIPYALFALVCGFLSPYTDMPSHIGGLLTGTLFGCTATPYSFSFKQTYTHTVLCVFTACGIVFFSTHQAPVPKTTHTCFDVSFEMPFYWELKQEQDTCRIENDAGLDIAWMYLPHPQETADFESYVHTFIHETLPQQTTLAHSSVVWKSPLHKTTHAQWPSLSIHTLIASRTTLLHTQYLFTHAHPRTYVFSVSFPALFDKTYTRTTHGFLSSMRFSHAQRSHTP